MTWDPLLLEDWPAEWTPFNVEVRPVRDRLELVAIGSLDPWTASALLRTLIAVCEPCFREIHLDLRGTSCGPADLARAIASCREFAEGRGLRLDVSGPSAGASAATWPTALPGAAG